MLNRITVSTIAVKFIILLINLLLVVFSTHIWGSEGRGEIALVLANISIITIFSNVFCGSTVAFHAQKIQREFLLSSSLIGALIISLAGAALFSCFFGFRYFYFVSLIALILSLTTAVSSYWLGKNKIRNYNLITSLSPLSILLTLAFFYSILNKPELSTYFKAYCLGAGLTLTAGIAGLILYERCKFPDFNKAGFNSIYKYGIKNEISYLIQFLNYRLSYYFIARLIGLSSLGVFSIVIAGSEAVWIISRSFSVIHFSNVINSNNRLKNKEETVLYARQSFLISFVILLVSASIPNSVYQIIFGEEFGEIRKYIIMLAPGILAMAVSNLYGHYFAGTGNMKILINKSLIGLGATLIFLSLLIKDYGLTGVCISLNISYIASSVYLWIKFKRKAGNEIFPDNSLNE
jgi:O-antigen/teichoic acid export membrane protein